MALRLYVEVALARARKDWHKRYPSSATIGLLNVVAVFDWPILIPSASPVTDRPPPRPSPTATAEPRRYHGATEERGSWVTEDR